jgi:hypothetical protein
MTIYSNRPAPAWDKSGERRIPMTHEMAKKLGAGSIKVAVVVAAKDGRWAFGRKEDEAKLREKKRGDFDTAPEAVAAAGREFEIIINTAPAAAAKKKGWELGPAARRVAEKVDLATAEERVAAHAAKDTLGVHRFAGKKQAAEISKKATKPGAKPRGKGIGHFCEAMIADGKTNAEILAAVAKTFPDAKTSDSSVNWYRNKMAKEAR